MIRIAVSDDNQECLENEKKIIMSYLILHDQDCEIDTYNSGKRLLDSVFKKEYDLIMLDVELQDMNGMDLAQKLHDINENIPIAFISAYMKYAPGGYQVNALRYILKDENLKESMEECLELLLKNLDIDKKTISLEFTIGERTIRVNDILYLKSQKNYTVFVVSGDNKEELKQKNSIRKVTDMMVKYDFVSVNSGESVNLHHIEKIIGNKIVLDNGRELDIPRRKYDELMNRYKLFKRGKGL